MTSGRLMDADYVRIEREGGQCLFLGPTHTADAHAESLRGGLQRGRRVAVEAEAEPEHVPLQAGQALDRVTNPVVDHGLLYVGYYLTGAALITLAGLAATRETKDEAL